MVIEIQKKGSALWLSERLMHHGLLPSLATGPKLIGIPQFNILSSVGSGGGIDDILQCLKMKHFM
jgi:hypothetical protein